MLPIILKTNFQKQKPTNFKNYFKKKRVQIIHIFRKHP